MNTEVTVLYFAKSAELTGVKSETIRVNSELTSLQLWLELEHKHPKLAAVREQVVLAVRREYVAVGEQVVRLQPGDEVAVIPRSAEAKHTPQDTAVMEDTQGLDLIKLTTDKLSVDAASESVTCSSCGAVSLFIGTTRDHFEGKKVVQLEYEAYVPMAESEMRKICVEMRRRWPTVRHVCIHHRLGVVPVTEASVIIGVSSPHRSDSLEAVKYGINALKSSVPIWKKEIYESEEPCWKENSECVWAGSQAERKTP